MWMLCLATVPLAGRQAGSGGMLVQTASEILTRKQKPKCRKTTGKLFEGSKTWVWGKTFCRTWWKVSENLIKIAADVAVEGGWGRGREGEGLEEREGERKGGGDALVNGSDDHRLSKLNPNWICTYTADVAADVAACLQRLCWGCAAAAAVICVRLSKLSLSQFAQSGCNVALGDNNANLPHGVRQGARVSDIYAPGRAETGRGCSKLWQRSEACDTVRERERKRDRSGEWAGNREWGIVVKMKPSLF